MDKEGIELSSVPVVVESVEGSVSYADQTATVGPPELQAREKASLSNFIMLLPLVSMDHGG